MLRPTATRASPRLLIDLQATAATWGSATEELARIGRVITYDRRGYARSGGQPVRLISTHTADAAAILESLQTPPAVVVGTSAGAAIAIDLAVRRPDLVRVVIAHEFPWRFTRHLPTVSKVAALAKIGSLVLRGRHGDAAEALLRSAHTYRDGGTAWDAFPEEWRRAGNNQLRAADRRHHDLLGGKEREVMANTRLLAAHGPAS
jgi:pimeloyl-ACP methyl ester carboxylesterase